ncbi:hypothetical protein [Bacteroides oleiciplenus]|uniref:Uncharacterized protein n=1 Tax=Bacteroides oleiciplenus YIT 12058 TaxID=742727 RepID=K9EB35_9BACE|nr:hypothetical protein [Bacteroides oleiciplenus]EKU88172.1 hypothetical protein HMPREF9447_04918 [Bacteroides oleiciplenus YIT 12058]
MGNDIDIRELWNKQMVPVVDQSDIFGKIESFRKKRIRRTIILNVVLLLTILFIIFIWVHFKPQLMSTKIGIILSVLPMGMVLVFNNGLTSLYRKIDEKQSNMDYLNALLEVRSREYIMQTKLMNLYFILLSAGIGLYMYEYTLNRSLIFGVAAYSVVLLWIGFNWFFLRPRMIEKNKRKMEDLIKQIKRLL